MTINYLANLGLYVPELLAIVTMVGLLFLEATYSKDDHNHKFVFFGSLVGLVCVLGSLLPALSMAPKLFFSKAVVFDSFATLLKIAMVIGTVGCILIGKNSKEIEPTLRSEFIVMSIGVLVGGMLLVSANNMLTLYLGIETLSILSYALASMKKKDERSSEAGLKYVLYGGLCAGIMLFGVSHIYGLVGSIEFGEIRTYLMNKELTAGQLTVLIPSFFLFFAGIGYKIACVPFHMWSPDVYEGSPTPVTAFFSIVPKVAGVGALARITMVFFQSEGMLHHSWVGLLSVVAAVTMTVGNVTAIGQKSVKRMLAFSSISHVGMIMMGILVLDDVGLRSVVFYLLTYVFMTLAAFFVVGIVAGLYGNDHFERFNGLIYRHPFMAIVLGIVMFSLAGLPPLSGFVAKFNILSAIINKRYYALALIAALNSVVSLYYYMKIVRLMVFKEAESNSKIEGFGFVNQAVIVALCVPVVMLGIFWEKIMILAQGAKPFIQ